MYDRANAFAFVHKIECLVDVFERHRKANELINLDVAAHVLIDLAWKLRTAFAATEGCASPHSAGNQLKRTSRDFLPCARNTDYDRFAPAFVTTFERGAHQVGVADTLEGIVDSTVCKFDDDVLNGVVIVLRVNTIRRTQLFR